MKVLLVDDSKVGSDGYDQGVTSRSSGMECVEASSAEEALRS